MSFPDYVSAQRLRPSPARGLLPMPVVFSLLRRAAVRELQRPGGRAWSDASRWFATSQNVTTQLMFYKTANPFPPLNRPNIPLQKHLCRTRAVPTMLGAFPFIITGLNQRRNPPNHGLKPRGLRQVLFGQLKAKSVGQEKTCNFPTTSRDTRISTYGTRWLRLR
jgi:hypothetical protein